MDKKGKAYPDTCQANWNERIFDKAAADKRIASAQWTIDNPSAEDKVTKGYTTKRKGVNIPWNNDGSRKSASKAKITACK
ncbi:hypothetical protein HDU89_008276 [Geranomyces variabilis]|nr:hypothetical protein HDU89_008276 [Geranomyces variabilis]